MAQSNRRNNRRQPRAQQSFTQTPVNSFFYEKRGKIGVVLAKTMSGLTTEIQVDELDHGITWFMSRLPFYAGYTPKNVGQINNAIREHAYEVQLSQHIAEMIKSGLNQLQLGEKSFLVVEDTAQNRNALGIQTTATSFAPPATKNGGQKTADTRPSF